MRTCDKPSVVGTQLGAERSLSCVQLADELKKYGLTLCNYASIREQSVGGFIQVELSAICIQTDP